MKAIVKKVVYAILTVFLFPLKFLVPKKNIAIFQTHDPEIYCENTKYIYEYLSKNTKIVDSYWVTESDEIKKYLLSKNFKYISRKNIFKFIWVTLRAKVVVDTGDQFFNPFSLIGKRVIKISTYHGNGPKTTATTFNSLKENLAEVYKINSFDYVNVPSAYSIIRTHRNIFKLPKSKIISLGFPRCDAFFEKETVEKKYKMKNVFKYLMGLDSIQYIPKIILYTPTWRPYEYDFPFDHMPGFTYESFDSFLKQNNTYFFFSTHTANLPKSIPSNLERIFYIDTKMFPFYDVNEFMLEVDILINDYSTTTTDFALLSKPQLHYMPDLDRYELEKGFVDDYKDVIPGPEFKCYDEMVEQIESYLHGANSYVSDYKYKIEAYLNKYYDCSKTDSCKKFSDFIINQIS